MRVRTVHDYMSHIANDVTYICFRYSMEWIYDALLLKIKSTSAYNFLMENEYLPLPDPRTLQSYISNLDANFGFRPDLFALLKEKMKELPERERRGKYMLNVYGYFWCICLFLLTQSSETSN